MTTDTIRFEAPEGQYLQTGTFAPPPQPIISIAPQVYSQAFMSSIYPTPRTSTVSVKYPSTSKSAKHAEKERSAAKAAAAAAAAIDSSNGSDASVTGDATHANGGAGLSVADYLGSSGGPLLEAPLAAQGIDAPASSLTGGNGGLAGIAGIGGQGMGFAGLGATMGRLSAKPSRPKNSVKNTSSNFVNRMVTHQDLAKILAQRTDYDSFVFLNNARSFFWLADTTGRMKEALARISFSASPSCHDVNQFTRSHDRLDIVIGFVTGDLLWLDPMSSRYTRINKGGAITSSAVTQVRWLPGSESLFMAAHADGTLIVYDRDREDSSDFVPASWTPSRSAAGAALQNLQRSDGADAGRSGGGAAAFPPLTPTGSRPSIGQRSLTASTSTTAGDASDGATPSNEPSTSVGETAARLGPSVGSSSAGPSTARTRAGRVGREDGEPLMLVTKPGGVPIASGLPSGKSRGDLGSYSGSANGLSGKGKETPWSRMNPVSHWRLSKSKVTDFAFSPDFSHVAIVAEDGVLRVADINSERLLDAFESYFGGINCVSWSPDGKFLLTGGQDDLVTVWAPREGRIVARCQGHTSFVTGLAWDPWRWRDDERTYRFATVGEDCKLIFWDFSSAALNKPKSHTAACHSAAARRSATGSTFSLLDKSRSPGNSAARRVSASMDRPAASPHTLSTPQEPLWHPPSPRSEVAILQPVVTADLGGEYLTGVRFRPDSVSVMRKNGNIETFARPAPRRDRLTAPGGRASLSADRSRLAESWQTTVAHLNKQQQQQQQPPGVAAGPLSAPPKASRTGARSLGFGGPSGGVSPANANAGMARAHNGSSVMA
ncbi:uncharacterized protein PFL1_01886 [Pseudozyma flocculosa PF-1]|uniref:Related to WD40 repeat protein CreC n=1 Tax=Pseudozyma flocculosa TaxID=84751 RepID=A0A5C3EZZ0_9BASI|nr:uncharacterized protein PFL1_01886 [Pseudozyma flocculosa PF-1]EPQ30360.1 hypothetical protein PFL1_01886 [Pseudozyma flocculosa PF-1]SPO37430.1 related to WD40 repeat protein CreC [Pseudozyma flocculosa]